VYLLVTLAALPFESMARTMNVCAPGVDVSIAAPFSVGAVQDRSSADPPALHV
jgi:hypothetical protein